MDIPVYLFTGFLDSGKTNFINGILEDGFAAEERTLIVCCEEGVEEYDPRWLKNVDVVAVEEEEELTEQFLKACQKKYRPQQVVIEYNGMWRLDRLYQEVLPSNWILYQIMTMVEAPTFDVYAKNMGQLMMEKLSQADMIVFNRCNDALRAALRKRNLKMVNRRADIFLENEDGTSEDYLTGDECAFDLTQEVIDIPDDDFGVWYVDVMDHPERYADKKVHFKAVMCRVPKYPDMVVPGRFAMVCCADDIAFLGLASRGEGLTERFGDRDWAELTAVISVEYHAAYGEEPGPMLNVIEAQPCQGPKEDLISF